MYTSTKTSSGEVYFIFLKENWFLLFCSFTEYKLKGSDCNCLCLITQRSSLPCQGMFNNTFALIINLLGWIRKCNRHWCITFPITATQADRYIAGMKKINTHQSCYFVNQVPRKSSGYFIIRKMINLFDRICGILNASIENFNLNK